MLYMNVILPLVSGSKQANAFLMTSSGSVPFNFSPNSVRNIVKFRGPTTQQKAHRELEFACS